MKAIVYERNGGPEVLEYRDVGDPKAAPGHVVIRTHAISIEGGDLIGRANMPPPIVPHIGGYQRAGVIEAIGEGVDGLHVGQRVTAFNWAGAYAELSCVPVHYVFPLPDGMEFESAAPIPATFGTASQAIFTHCNLQAGETILVTGASGGVGIAAVQLAKHAGATVIGVASSDEYLERLKTLGMDYGINYKSEDVGKACKAITKGQGVDLAMDNIGGKMTKAMVTAAAEGARISIVGQVADPMGSHYTSMGLISKQLTARGTFFGKDMHTPQAREMIASIIERVAKVELTMPIDKRFALENAEDAHRYIESDHSVFGRVIMTA